MTCLLGLVGGAAWLTQSRYVLSETKQERVRSEAADARQIWEDVIRPAPLSPEQTVSARGLITREWTIAMVLPHDEQNDERAFRQYLLRHHGKVRFVPVFFSGRQDDGPALIAQLRAIHPDLIYSWGTPTTLAVAGRYDDADTNPSNGTNATSPDYARIRDIPIVFAEVTDPVGVKLLPSLEVPGRNVTGVPHIAPLPTQLALLNAYRRFEKIGFIDNPLEPNSGVLLAQLTRASAEVSPYGPGGDKARFQVLSETLQPDAQGNIPAQQIQAAVGRLKARGAQVLYVGASTLLAFTYRDVLTASALSHNLPTFCTTESILRQADCLYGIFSNGANIGQYAAFKAERILSGKQTADTIAANPLQRFSVLINMPVARKLGLYPPLSLLPLAEVVSERPGNGAADHDPAAAKPSRLAP